jgi:PIN domain nuclease of toxin-antitoxin system
MASVPVIYLDSHVVVWLYDGVEGRLSDTVVNEVELATDLRISPMVRIELQYLFEIGRTDGPPALVLDELFARIGLTVCTAAFSAVAIEAERLTWPRDPFDRIIVAQASLHGARLITRDSDIRKNYPRAVWL